MLASIAEINPYAWITLGIGFVLTAIGAIDLYGEVQAIRTGNRPPEAVLDGPEAVQAGQRVMGWIAIVILFGTGVIFLYLAGYDIYSILVG